MNLLPLDMARCLGDNGTGVVCAKREKCLRYLDMHKNGLHSWVALLCRDDRYTNRIPLRNAE